MKLPLRSLAAALLPALALFLPGEAAAQQPAAYCPPGQAARASWLFDQSYYSHDPVHNVRIGGRHSAGGPLYSRPQGWYFSGGNRQVRSRIQIGGQTFDQVNLFESWGQQGSQF